MNLLTPPTDSLYKFWAISSVLICASLMIWTWNETDAMRERIYSLGLEAARARVEVRFGTEEIERLRLQRKQVQDEASARRLREREATIARELVVKAAERRYNVDRAAQLVQLLERNTNFAIVMVLLFFVNGTMNFWVWYMKVQRFQDELLRLQVEAARRTAIRESSPQIGNESSRQEGSRREGAGGEGAMDAPAS